MLEVNAALAAAKLLRHMRLEGLTYNQKGNLSDLLLKDGRADFLLLKYRELFLKEARRQNLEVVDVTANEEWQGLRVHGVPLDHYYNGQRMVKLMEELAQGPQAIDLAVSPRCVASPTRMQVIVRDGPKAASTIEITVGCQADADPLIAQGAIIAGRTRPVDRHHAIAPDSQCLTCAKWVILPFDAYTKNASTAFSVQALIGPKTTNMMYAFQAARREKPALILSESVATAIVDTMLQQVSVQSISTLLKQLSLEGQNGMNRRR